MLFRSGGATGANCKQYYEFLLDTNQQDALTTSGISLDEFKLFTAATGNITAHTGEDDTKGITNFQITGATLRYDMDAGPGGDASILTDYSNFSGSGNGLDLQVLVPVSNFAGAAPDSFVYLYSKFGWTSTQCQNSGNNASPCLTPDGTNGPGTTISPSGNGKTPAGTLNFEANAGFEEWSTRRSVPLPATALLFAVGLMGLGFSRKFNFS